ncbi:MAG: non-canonical purine NTP diphosphatase [Prevotella shahii]|uniref:non-canonical purine NTP diphosphatase n=1 Tax=Hoylesella shahii TaxID=228603 RepID=UPI001CAC6512|nr:non-canonical purine NTP diphosphatase [Hoylesella shahii]MBF1590140.1 non-canonical purine NTP diphosphatase [Hoylesella shahii]
MNRSIVFATNNAHKLEEIRQIMPNNLEVLSLKDIGCDVDIPETGATLEENALIKAQYVLEHYGLACFADDTGLEVTALNNEPGVYSARYAGGVGHDSEANMAKLLAKLADNTHREARFRTVIALVAPKENTLGITQPLLFEGVVTGNIATQKQGNEGFGYDPLFVPDGYDKTFAELGANIKNQISHRARAVGKLVDYLKR